MEFIKKFLKLTGSTFLKRIKPGRVFFYYWRKFRNLFIRWHDQIKGPFLETMFGRHAPNIPGFDVPDLVCGNITYQEACKESYNQGQNSASFHFSGIKRLWFYF